MSEIARDGPSSSTRKHDFKFWLVLLAIGVSTAITALELSAISTALPTITRDLHGSSFVWVGSAYALAATAFIPMTGDLAQIFGRRPVVLGALLIMAIGSALCGAASTMNFLIAGRTIQGIGGGGIASITAIIISDLVPLHERGVFNGLIGIAWACASGIGPIVGGELAEHGQWRWLFYLNIPICGVAAVLMFLFLRVRTPPGSIKDKLERMDWRGNVLVIASTTSMVIALTWGGVQYPWSSARVIVPLVFGLVGLIAYVIYETFLPDQPVTSLTGLSGYLQTSIMPILMLGIIYYMPVYFQACKGASPTGSGVDLLAASLVLAPAGIIGGLSVKKTGKYRPQLWLAWVLLVTGTGSLMTLKADTPLGTAIGLLVIVAVGVGILTTTTYFPVLAPLDVSQNAQALAFFMFLRNFAQVWGVTVGGAVLQNELHRRLPAALLAQLPGGNALAYAAIPAIRALPAPLRAEVRAAFAASLRRVWGVLAGIGGAGLLASLAMRALPLHTGVDEKWALEQEEKQDTEAGVEMARV